MRRNILLFISLCVVGCAMMYAQQMPGLLQKGKADTQDCKAWVDEQLSEMSLKEKIGQLFIHTVAPLQTQRNKNNIYAAIKEYKVSNLVVAGGVSANSGLREKLTEECQKENIHISFPELKYCTDNATMIAAAAYFAYQKNLTLNAMATDTIYKEWK